jgi:hypothetical protein
MPLLPDTGRCGQACLPGIDRFETGAARHSSSRSPLTSAEVEFDQFEPSGDAELGKYLVQVVFDGLARKK